MGNRVAGTVGWLISALAVWIGFSTLIASAGERTPVDGALPLIGVAMIVVAWSVRRTRFAAAIAMAAPLLMVAELAVSDERSRLLLIGAVVAGAVTGAVASVADRDGVPTSDARVLSLLFVLLVRLVGWQPGAGDILQSVVVVAGIAALVQLFSSAARRVPIACMALCFTIGLVTPSFPFAACLFPLVLALLGVSLRTLLEQRSGEPLDRPLLYAASGGAIALSVMTGRWLLGITVATLLGAALGRQRWRGLLLLPVVAAGLLIPQRVSATIASLRAWLVAPFLVADGIASPLVAMVSLVLAVIAIASRPAIAPLVALTAAVVGALLPQRWRLEVAMPVFAILSIGLLAWSGLPARLFPLPLTLAALALIAATSVTGRFAFIIAAAGVAFVTSYPLITSPGAATLQPVGVALAPGASFQFEEGVPAAVVVSGANVAHLRSGTLLGRAIVTDERGHATHRDIRIGDASDWGFLRRQHDFYSRNPLPAEPRGRLIGYGYDAFLTGGGRVPMPVPLMRGVTARITAAASLPGTARLQIDALELAP